MGSSQAYPEAAPRQMSDTEMIKVRIQHDNTFNVLKTSIHRLRLLYLVEISLSIEGKMGMSLCKQNQAMCYKQISIKEMLNRFFLCVYMNVHVYVSMRVCVSRCRGQRTFLSVIQLELFTLCFEAVSLACSCLSRPGWPASKPQAHTHLSAS